MAKSGSVARTLVPVTGSAMSKHRPHIKENWSIDAVGKLEAEFVLELCLKPN